MLSTEAFRDAEHQFPHIGAFDTQGTKIGNHPAKFIPLLLDHSVQIRQFRTHLVGRLRQFATQDTELDVQTEQGLEYPVVKVSRNSAALRFNGSSLQTAQEKEVLERGTKVADDLFEPAQIAFRKSPRSFWIEQQNPPKGTPAGFHRHRQQRLRPKFLARRSGRRGQGPEPLARPAIPAEAFPGSVLVFPAHRNFEGVKEKRIAAREGQGFRSSRPIVARAELPNEQPLEFFVARCQTRLFALKDERQLAEGLPNRLGETTIEMEQAADSFKELLARKVFPLARP